MLFILTVSAVSATSDTDDASLGYDLTNETTGQNIIDTVNENNDDSEIKTATDNDALKESGITEVQNWGELKGAVQEGAVIELNGDDVYYA